MTQFIIFIVERVANILSAHKKKSPSFAHTSCSIATREVLSEGSQEEKNILLREHRRRKGSEECLGGRNMAIEAWSSSTKKKLANRFQFKASDARL